MVLTENGTRDPGGERQVVQALKHANKSNNNLYITWRAHLSRVETSFRYMVSDSSL